MVKSWKIIHSRESLNFCQEGHRGKSTKTQKQLAKTKAHKLAMLSNLFQAHCIWVEQEEEKNVRKLDVMMLILGKIEKQTKCEICRNQNKESRSDHNVREVLNMPSLLHSSTMQYWWSLHVHTTCTQQNEPDKNQGKKTKTVMHLA